MRTSAGHGRDDSDRDTLSMPGHETQDPFPTSKCLLPLTSNHKHDEHLVPSSLQWEARQKIRLTAQGKTWTMDSIFSHLLGLSPP